MSTNVTEYIQFNFETLPKDVLLLLMQQLTSKEVVALCSANVALQNRCNAIGALNQTLEREAPLAKQTYNVTEQLHLLDRGYETVYSANLIYGRDPEKEFDYPTRSKLTDVRFGFPYVEFTDTRWLVGKVTFSIKGLPPPKGTRVFVMGYPGTFKEMHLWNRNYIMAFESKDDALSFVKNNTSYDFGPGSILTDIALDHNDMDVDKLLNILKLSIWDDNKYIGYDLKHIDALIFQYVTLP